MTGATSPAAGPGPIRSLLFVPGNRGDWVESARRSGADAVVFDLEDAVPVSEQEAARRVVADAVEQYGASAPRLMVRIGPPGTAAAEADLEAVVRPGIGGIMMPLVTSPEEVRQVAARLDRLEAERGIEAGSTVIMPLVETAQAARMSYEIATSTPRVAYMGGGTSRQGDLARSLGYQWTPEGTETLMMRSWVLMNVRAAGVAYPVSGMWSVLDDMDGLRAFAKQTRMLGYTGIMVIHPSHVPVANEVFTPTAADVLRWREVIQAMRSAQADGRGAIRFHGELLDEAHVKTAELGLALASRLSVATD
jgi:citrate lyase subunit beta/citryl-CoA lyase